MTEIVFTESASASLAMSGKIRDKSLQSIAVLGEAPEFKDLPKSANESASKTLPSLRVRRSDILTFGLDLSCGEINQVSPHMFFEQRSKTLERLFKIYPQKVRGASKDIISSAQKNLTNLMSRVKAKEEIRIWTSNSPNEYCGLCWIMFVLETSGFPVPKITVVPLPELPFAPDGKPVLYSCWGQVPPEHWGYLSSFEKAADEHCTSFLSSCWKKLQRENAPLRLVINGRLMSAPESALDFYILREISKVQSVFNEAEVVGKTLSELNAGISDAFIALRIEDFISRGILKGEASQNSDAPLYHRMLSKTDKTDDYIKNLILN